MYEYVGNLHVHSTYSDGSGSIAEIAEAGRKAGLDFVVINDHYTLQGLEQEELYYEDVLVLVGMEVNRSCHHYLAMGIKEVVVNNDLSPQQVIDQVKKQGGIGFIAHPFESGSPLFFSGKTFPWTNWEVEGYNGICVWNYCSQWRDGADNVFSALYTTLVNPNYRITGPCPKAMAKLDELGQNRRIVAIGGSDAHAVKVKYGPIRLTVFPYEYLFRTVNTHIITPQPFSGELAKDKRLILTALKEGSCFIAMDFYKSSRGFRCWLQTSEDEKIPMGQELVFRDGLKIVAKLPYMGLIKVINNGNVVYERTGHSLDYLIDDKGVFRVEIYLVLGMPKKQKPWIFTNPFFVR